MMELVRDTEKKILLIDDEEDITDLIEDILHKEGFKNIFKAHCGVDGIAVSRKENPDIVVLDVIMPDIDGIEVCREIRKFSYCSILFLSARNSDVDKIIGLSTGGDDYITKPFSPREIVYRIKAQLRRQKYNRLESTEESTPQTITIGNIEIDPLKSQVYRSGKEVKLTVKEYKLLLYMAENPNIIISKERLFEVVWGGEYVGYDNTISVHMRHLREKLEDNPSQPEIIVTVIGFGYKLVKRNEQ